MFKIFKYLGLGLLSMIILLLFGGILFINLSPQFGRSPSAEQIKSYQASGHHNGEKFVNRTPAIMDIKFWSLLKKQFADAPKRNPARDITVEKIDSLDIVNYDKDTTRITWFGHSAFLLEIEGKKILLDPMLSEVPAPHPWLGPKRYSSALPIAIERLPVIDAVLISHDHYDHLDYESISLLKEKTRHFYTSLGVGNHLEEWGVEPEKITELNWWDSANFVGIKLVSAPARHFSGRGLTDRQATLWCSWVIQGKTDKIYFSGDGGYDIHFKEIGEKYGPFDLSLLECGQYNEQWKAIHMMPEETVQAAIDLNSKVFMPIHWGAFTLALHDWTDPVERASQEARRLDQPITTPRIGQSFQINTRSYPTSTWWELY
jgi:L-ascorbate metabolism protein UlaG (beta-lactamase superfamily)